MGNVEPNLILFMITARLMVRFMNGAVAERNSSVNRANVIEPLHRRREKEEGKKREGSTVRERLPCRETRSPTLSDCIPNVVLEERVTIRIRGRQESGPTGFPLIVPDAMDDTVCRNAHGVVCPFERLRAGHVLPKGYHHNHRSVFLFVPLDRGVSQIVERIELVCQV